MDTSIERKLIYLAQNECANWSEVGPFKKKHYCCCEPRHTESACLLLHEIPCRYFRDAVLPLKPELRPEWDIFCKRSEPSYQAQDAEDYHIKTCGCGVKFKPRSNRQTSCPACTKKRGRQKARERKARQRANVGVASHALGQFRASVGAGLQPSKRW